MKQANSDSDRARQYANEAYLRPAKRRGERTFSVNVGSVHRSLDLHNRVPLVCAALKSRKFLQENGLKLITQTGPPSGQSTTVTYTYEILGDGGKVASLPDPLSRLRGAAKDVFGALGGGEAFIREERKNFSTDGGAPGGSAGEP
jgi:hypothetical protein